MRKAKLLVLVVGLLVCGGLGVVAAVAWSPEASVTEGAVERVRHGVTETGHVEVVTTEGQVRRVIRWEEEAGGNRDTNPPGAAAAADTRQHVSRNPAARPPGLQPMSPGLHPMRLPGGAMTLPATTVLQTVTE